MTAITATDSRFIAVLSHDYHHGPPHQEWDTVYVIQMDTREGESLDRYSQCYVCDRDVEDDTILAPDGRVFHVTEWTEFEDEDHLHEWEYDPDLAYWIQWDEVVDLGARPPDRIDGVILVHDTKEWRSLTTSQRRANAEGELHEYLIWAKGEIYSCLLMEENCPEDCEHVDNRSWRGFDDYCQEHSEELDSIGGLFGDEAVEEFIHEALGVRLGIPFAEARNVDYDTVYE